MNSKNEEISSVFERFRQYLIKNDSKSLLEEFNNYRQTWSTNKFRMFLTNVLVVMRTWSENYHQISLNTQDEDWDNDNTISTNTRIQDNMKISAHDLFLTIVDYLQSEHMTNDIQFDIWKRIVTNKWTMNEKFYIYLYHQQICLPTRLTETLHNDMYDFYLTTSQWSSSTKRILIDLDFIYLLIHDNVFLGCNHILTSQIIFTLNDYMELIKHSQINPENYKFKLIISMNTPEKMKIFLDYYPNIDLTELIAGNSDLYQQRTPVTIFDRLLKMEPFYYETTDQLQISDIPDFNSDQQNVRAANILYLFQKLVSKGAKFSIPLDSAYYQNHRIPFFVSTIGFYLLSILRYRDTCLVPAVDSSSSNDIDNDHDILPVSLSITNRISQNINPIYLDSLHKTYIYYIIKRASTFSPLFRSFFYNHLNLCCPFLHKTDFENERNSIKNIRLRTLYNELIENRPFLTLKQRCRLLIKDSIKQYPLDIAKLIQLPSTLQYYLSFDLLNPNFVQIILTKLNQVNGRIKPTFFDELQFHEHNFEQINAHHDWEDQIPDDMDNDNDNDNDDENEPEEYDDGDADLFDEEGLYSDNDVDEDEW